MTLNFGANLFPPRGEISISYDYATIQDGVGIISFDAISSHDSLGAKHSLLSSKEAANFKSITGYNGSNTLNMIDGIRAENSFYEESLNVDFDLATFKIPQQVEGAGLLSMSYSVKGVSAGAISKINIAISKISNGTETVLITKTSKELIAYNVVRALLFNFSLPKTNFKIGDTLRLNITGEGKEKTAGGYAQIAIAGDPSNNIGFTTLVSIPAGQTAIKLMIPFKIAI